MHPLAEPALTAYAAGVAATGAPVTSRVRAGARAAVALAIEHADDLRILEATLHLGRLEGTWAGIFDRREKAHTSADRKILAGWRKLVAGLDLADAIRQLRPVLGLAEADTDQQQERDRQRGQAAAIILAVLMLLTRTDGWTTLNITLSEAFTDAHSAGWDAANRLLDEARKVLGYPAGEDPGLGQQTASGMAADTLLAALAATARQLARHLTGGGYDPGDGNQLDGDMRTWLASGRDLSLAVDTAMSVAYVGGMIAAYLSRGVHLINFVTAGDGRVCPQCAAAEDGNPYQPTAFPRPPLHPGCRCIPAPA